MITESGTVKTVLMTILYHQCEPVAGNFKRFGRLA